MPRMMQAVVVALKGPERTVGIALKVLDTRVDSFNPEFIEKSMGEIIQPLMANLWGHIRPHPCTHLDRKSLRLWES